VVNPFFRSNAQYRIATLLFLVPRRTFTPTEIERATGLNRRILFYALADLAGAGVIDPEQRSGAYNGYRANTDHQMAPELLSIAVRSLGGNDDLVDRISAAPSIDSVTVFGSYAKGSAEEHSDIDLLIVADGSDPDVTDIEDEIARRGATLGRSFNVVRYSAAELAARRDTETFLSRVLAGPRIAIKGAL
jgi:predicted nucleotidyltransferase